MGFDHFDYVVLTNHLGGITVLWNNDKIHASPFLKEPRAIHMLIHNPEKAYNSSSQEVMHRPNSERKISSGNIYYNLILPLIYHGAQ